MLEPIIRPLPIRVLSAAARGLEPLGWTLPPVSPDGLERAARRVDGLSDLGSPDYREGLEVACAAVMDQNSGIGPFGRLAFRDTVIQALSTRARWVQMRRQQDARLQTTLVPPLVVVGLPRSGTTFLHRMLSICADSRPLKTWEVRQPLPPPRGPDRRRAIAQRQLRIIKRIAPQLDAKHFMDADEPEECFPMLNPTMVSAAFWCLFPLYPYLEWYFKQDHQAAYAFWVDMLRCFQAQTPGLRLTLKAPAHTPHIDAIGALLPDATVVMTHRPVAPVVASSNSLFYTLHSVIADTVDVKRMGQTCLTLLPDLLRRAEAARSALGDRLIDVRYADIVSNPLDVVEMIRQRIGAPFSDRDRRTLQTFIDNRRQHRHGRHEYSLDECGLTEDAVHHAFADLPDRT